MPNPISSLLDTFKKDAQIGTKGPHCVVLYLTRLAIEQGLPLDPNDLVTAEHGQVKGLGVAPVQKILNDYGIKTVLAKEGGRTSRGSLGNMKRYVPFLNALEDKSPKALKEIEAYWVESVKRLLASKPFILNRDHTLSLSSAILALLAQAQKKQKDNPSTMYVGAVMQHLVGAKLELVLKDVSIEHNGSSVSDDSTSRTGDFFIGTTSIHVTTNPSEALLQKCNENLAKNYRPIIVTKGKGVTTAQSLAENIGIQSRVDVYDVEQFVSLNLYEKFHFDLARQEETLNAFVDIYNRIIDDHETDPSLRIEIK
jgi:hypothetical protein